LDALGYLDGCLTAEILKDPQKRPGNSKKNCLVLFPKVIQRQKDGDKKVWISPQKDAKIAKI
jgi:hypothetical protein